MQSAEWGKEKGERDARIPFAKKRCFSCTNHPWYALFVAATFGTGSRLPRCANASGNMYLHCRSSYAGCTSRVTIVGRPSGAPSWKKPTSLHLQNASARAHMDRIRGMA